MYNLMRYRGKRIEFLPHLYFDIDKEEYMIAEAKRLLAIRMIENLPFKVETAETPYGYKYRISLDVAIEDYEEFKDKYVEK